jgi:hypothetical protein
MQSFDVCDDGLVGKSTVVRKQSANFRVSTPLVTGTNITVAGSSCSRGAETGAFDTGPSTIALTFDSPLLKLLTLTHQKQIFIIMSGLAFDNHLVLTIVCRFQEVSNFLNTQNTFEFDHPMSLMIFKKTVHPSLMNCIKSIWLNLQRDLYNPGRPTQAFKFLRLDVWPECGTLSLE